MPTFEKPSVADLRHAADALGMNPSMLYLNTMQDIVAPLCAAYTALDAVPDDKPASMRLGVGARHGRHIDAECCCQRPVGGQSRARREPSGLGVGGDGVGDGDVQRRGFAGDARGPGHTSSRADPYNPWPVQLSLQAIQSTDNTSIVDIGGIARASASPAVKARCSVRERPSESARFEA